MGLHVKTRKILEDKAKLKRFLAYYEMFGLKATMNRYGLGNSALNSIKAFVKEHPDYLTESEENDKI